MKLRLDSEIDVRNRRDLEAWAEAFDVFAWHVQQAVRIVGSRPRAVKNYLYAMGHVGARSSSPAQSKSA